MACALDVISPADEHRPSLADEICGLWFLAASFGSKIASLLGGHFSTADPAQLATFFGVLAAIAAVATVLMLFATPRLKRMRDSFS